MDDIIITDSEVLEDIKISEKEYCLYIVNFLSHPHIHKIGVSKDITTRLAVIEHSSFLGNLDYKALYIKTYNSWHLAKKTEKIILKKLKKRQVRGEWFAINKNERDMLIKFINNNKLELIEKIFHNKIDIFNEITLDKDFIKNGMIEFNKIHQSSFIIYLILLAHSIDSRTSEISIKTLCKCSGLAKNTVCDIIKDLENRKYISKIGRNAKKVTIYDLRGLN